MNINPILVFQWQHEWLASDRHELSEYIAQRAADHALEKAKRELHAMLAAAPEAPVSQQAVGVPPLLECSIRDALHLANYLTSDSRTEGDITQYGEARDKVLSLLSAAPQAPAPAKKCNCPSDQTIECMGLKNCRLNTTAPAPAQWQELSRSEIDSMIDDSVFHMSCHEITSAISAALRAKNGGGK